MEKSKKVQWPQLRYFFSFFKPQWKLIVFSGIGIYLSVIMQLPLPLVTRYIIDNVVTGKNHALLNWIILGLFLVVIIQQVSGILTSYASNLFRERVLNSFQLKLFGHIMRLNISFFNNRKSGYLLRRIQGDVLNLRGLIADNIMLLAKDILTFITGSVIIFLFHWKLALASILVLPLFIFSLFYFSRRIRYWSGNVQEQSANVMGFLQEALSGIFVVKAFQLENKEESGFYEQQQKRLDVKIKYGLISALSSNTTAFLGVIGPLVVLWYGSHEVMSGHLTLGTLVAFNAFLGYLFGPARRFMSLNEQIQDALVSLDRVFEFFSLPTEGGDRILSKRTAPEYLSPEIIGKVRFQDVGFSYTEDEPVLENLSFTVNPGETAALVGKSGAGKTTLVKLIFRFFDPQAGNILLDGMDLRERDINNLREHIGMVPQDVFLFSGTIRDNIRCANEDASEEELLRAVRLAHVDEFLAKLPNGLDTKVGERGAKLSGGQRQRIALARVILKDAKILILDEPTSELDSLSERYIRGSLEKISINKTTFIIAHRLSTIKNADKIIFMENGRIKDEGTHQNLYDKCSDYQEFYRTHFDTNRQVS